MQDQAGSFTKELRFWEEYFDSNQTECFYTLQDFLSENEL
jgi:hypothetical protein